MEKHENYIYQDMAAGFQGFDDGEAKIFELAGSADDLEAKDLHENNSSEEERSASGSEDGIVLNVVDSSIMQIGRENELNFSSGDSSLALKNSRKIAGENEGKPVLIEHWKPKGRLSIGRSRSGFPDCHDHSVQLLVCKNEQTREVLDIGDKYEIAVAVRHDEAGGYSLNEIPDCQYKRIKSESSESPNGYMLGVVGFHFRFHEPDTKYKINFSLIAKPQRKRGRKKRECKEAACEAISEISITLETGAKAFKPGKARKTGKARIVSPLSALSPASLSEESVVLWKRSSLVMNELQSRRDNARWDDFHSHASSLLLGYTDADTQIAIKLEQSVGACYQNKLDLSLQLIDEAFSLIHLAMNSQLLAARGYGYRAGVMRRQRNLGKAESLVQLAEQSGHACHASLDTCFIVYERASVLLDFIGRMTHKSPKLVNEALRYLEKCIDLCLRAEMEDDELYVKKHHFALIKIAMLLLDCRTEAARERVVSERFITKGEECLNRLKTKYWKKIAEGVKVQFNLASSDLEYRKGNFEEAAKFASEAKVMAVALGFNTEISHAQERLDHLQALTRGDAMPASGVRRLFGATHAASESEGEYGDVSSSGAESDWLRILE